MHSNSTARGFENPTDYREQKDNLGSLAYLAAMPFHHLLSAEQIYSSITAESPDVKIPGILNSPAERLQMFQKAAADQTVLGAEAVPLDRFLQIKFSDTDFEGEEIEVGWLVVFRDELQGCGEIYRAEMLLFKRMLYEQKEELQIPLIITNEGFRQYLDYELFDQLTSNDTDRLFIHSLSASYQISFTSYDEEESDEQESENNGNQTKVHQPENNFDNSPEETEEDKTEEVENGAAILTDRIHDCKSYYAERRKFEKFGKIENREFLKSDSLIGDADKEDDNSGRIAEKPEVDAKKAKKEALRIFELNIAAYWRKWRQAARLAGFDFDLLKTLNDSQAIRFYELTKLLRLSSYDETAQTLPAELEIDYEWFALLMPLPKFHSEDKIKKQITDLIQPLLNAGYVENVSHSAQKHKEKSVSRIYFKFHN